jgi:hypothetical protein
VSRIGGANWQRKCCYKEIWLTSQVQEDLEPYREIKRIAERGVMNTEDETWEIMTGSGI